MHKPCTQCGGPHSGAHRSICKPCMARRAKDYYHSHKEQIAASTKRYRMADPSRAALNYRRGKLKMTYGLSLEAYDARLSGQNHQCKICKTAQPGGPGNKFMVDHDHTTRQIRGLLCVHCNFLIGHCKESRTILTAAISYLEEYQGVL